MRTDIIQHSPEWFVARRGWATTSPLHKLMTRGAKDQRLAAWESYWNEKRVELATDPMHVEDHLFSREQWKWIQWGIDHQPDAAMLYEVETGAFLEDGGWWVHDDHSLRLGSSPDYLVGEHGLLEVKCPLTSTHLTQLEPGADIPVMYQWQMQGQMMVTGREWCDFMSYDPRVREGVPKFWIKRLYRNQAEIQAIECELRYFWEKMDEYFKKLAGQNGNKKSQQSDADWQSGARRGNQIHAAGYARGPAVARHQPTLQR